MIGVMFVLKKNKTKHYSESFCLPLGCKTIIPVDIDSSDGVIEKKS